MCGKSNAVEYSNSVLGTRTEKYVDYFLLLWKSINIVVVYALALCTIASKKLPRVGKLMVAQMILIL